MTFYLIGLAFVVLILASVGDIYGVGNDRR